MSVRPDKCERSVGVVASSPHRCYAVSFSGAVQGCSDILKRTAEWKVFLRLETADTAPRRLQSKLKYWKFCRKSVLKPRTIG